MKKSGISKSKELMAQKRVISGAPPSLRMRFARHESTNVVLEFAWIRSRSSYLISRTWAATVREAVFAKNCVKIETYSNFNQFQNRVLRLVGDCSRKLHSSLFALFLLFFLGGALVLDTRVQAGPPQNDGSAKASDATPSGAKIAISSVNKSPRDTILFSNGDILYGVLDGIEPETSLRWRHPDALDVIEFAPESVAGIEFGFRPQPLFHRKDLCRVQLADEDAFEGNLLECDAEKLILETWYAGRIVVPRSVVRLITPKPNEPPPIFEGPSGPEDWTFGKVRGGIPNAGEWNYKSGAFFATKSASIARDVKLPDVASIQFDLAWKGMLYVAIALYTDYLEPVSLQTKESEPPFGGFYSLQLSSYTVNLIPVTQTDPLRYLGQTSVPTFSQKNRAHIDVRVNKAKRTTTLMVDGALVKQWIDTDRFVGDGTGLRFVHQGQGAIKLNNIKVSTWDGQFEEKLSSRPNRSEDLLTLRNGDKVSGKVESIQNGELKLTASDGAVTKITLDRVKFVEMAAIEIPQVTHGSGNVKATFRNGGTITFRLEKWTSAEVIGTSSSFGRITFHPSAFDRMDISFSAKGQ